MPKNIHNDKFCRTTGKEVSETKGGKCEFCKAELASIIFEDELVMLLKAGLLYAIEPKTAKSYKTKYQNALEVK